MRLTKLSEFRRIVYAPGSAPKIDTLRAQISVIPGGTKVAGRYYVDLDAFDSATLLRQSIEAKRAELARDPLLAGLI
jgi:hypothetical protein